MFQLLERTGLDDDPKAAMLVGAAAVHPSPVVAERIQQLVSLKAAKHWQYPFSEQSERSDLATVHQNQIQLGTTFTGSQYTLNPDDLVKHLLVVGTTGMGKTTFFYQMMDELPVPYWSFDLKTDYRHLRQRNPDLLVLPWTRLRLNPFRPPPRVTPRTWAQTVTDLLGDSYNLYSGSENYLLPIFIDMYEEHDIDVDTRYSRTEVADLPWPRCPQLRAYLRQSGRTGASRTQLRNRLIDRFGSILAATGDLYTESHGFPLADLLEQDVVFELQGLKTDHQDFIIEYLLTWVFRYRQAQQQRGAGLQHAFVLDEGKRAFSIYKERDDLKGLPQIDVLTAQLREFGEALLVGDQEPGKLTDALHSNTGTTVLFRIEEGEQFRAMARSLKLSERQRSFADRLDVGQAIVKSGSRDAVPVQFPYVDVDKSVTDDRLEQELRSEWNWLSSSTDSSFDAAEQADEPSASEDSAGNEVTKPDELSGHAKTLLEDVVRHPYYKLTDHYDELAFSRPAGNSAKKELLEAGLVEEHQIKKKYGRPTVLGLTADGEDWLRQRGFEIEYRGRGGPRHRYWQHFFAEQFEQAGYDATIEGDHADIAVDADVGRVAVEVAMTWRDREVEHVSDRFASGFDAVVIGCPDEPVLARLKWKLDEAELLDDERVAVQLLRDLQTAFEDFL